MKQYHIFHATGPNRFEEVDVQPRMYAGCVEASSIEEAFVKSQNWNEHSLLLGEENWNTVQPCRSTSVGDVIQDGDQFFMVLGIGFKELVSEVEEDAETAIS